LLFARIDAVLADPPLDAINANFEETYDKRRYDPPWYEVFVASAKLRN
jgi:hypothetical protein